MISKIIKLENETLKKHLEDNKKIADEINEIVEDWKKKDEYVKKLSMKMERIKEKIRPLIADEVKKQTELGEFDIVASTKIVKGEIQVEILDQIELYKDQIRKQKDERQKQLDNLKKQVGDDKGDGKSDGEKEEVKTKA